eukprot:4569273-Karenia_brevis.AAC.1
MEWPSVGPFTSLSVILDTAWFDNGDPAFPSPWPYPIPRDMCPCKRKNLNRAIMLWKAKARKEGVTPEDKCAVVDLG